MRKVVRGFYTFSCWQFPLEGSDTPDFAHPDTFYTIEQAPDYLAEQAIHPERSYRYVRYYSPDRDIHVAEIQFCTKNIHGNDQLLAGAPIAYLSDDTTPPETVKNAFDDDKRHGGSLKIKICCETYFVFIHIYNFILTFEAVLFQHSTVQYNENKKFCILLNIYYLCLINLKSS